MTLLNLLLLSVLVSALALALSLLMMRFVKSQNWRYAGIALPAALAYLGDGTPATLQLLAIAVLAFLWTAAKWSFRTFAYAAVIASVGSYGLIFVVAYVQADGYAALREENAQEFLSERLPPPLHARTTNNSAGPSAKRLESMESAVGWGGNDGRMRYMALRNLHVRRMDTFVSNAGFGAKRMISRPTAETLKMPNPGEPLPQPGSLEDLQWSDNVIAKEPTGIPEEDLFKLHLGGVVDFVNPRGFGYVSDEKQLFGFQPHHFHKLPKADAWQVRSLELVSLQLHNPPMIYVTKNLPRMQEIRAIPTRPLDLFESTGLTKLESGDDLFIRATPNGLRMLGALRSVEQCLQCHGGERGDLLGAFSYSLTRVP